MTMENTCSHPNVGSQGKEVNQKAVDGDVTRCLDNQSYGCVARTPRGVGRDRERERETKEEESTRRSSKEISKHSNNGILESEIPESTREMAERNGGIMLSVQFKGENGEYGDGECDGAARQVESEMRGEKEMRGERETERENESIRRKRRNTAPTLSGAHFNATISSENKPIADSNNQAISKFRQPPFHSPSRSRFGSNLAYVHVLEFIVFALVGVVAILLFKVQHPGFEFNPSNISNILVGGVAHKELATPAKPAKSRDSDPVDSHSGSFDDNETRKLSDRFVNSMSMRDSDSEDFFPWATVQSFIPFNLQHILSFPFSGQFRLHRLQDHRQAALVDETGKKVVGAIDAMGGIMLPRPEDLKHWVGSHLIVEFFNVSNLEPLENADVAEKMTLKALAGGNLTLISMASHQFKPTGVTLVALLMESHLSMHSWPEYKYASVDIFTCGATANPSRAAEIMRQELDAGQFVVAKMPRGHPHQHLLDPPIAHQYLDREMLRNVKFAS